MSEQSGRNLTQSALNSGNDKSVDRISSSLFIRDSRMQKSHLYKLSEMQLYMQQRVIHIMIALVEDR